MQSHLISDVLSYGREVLHSPLEVEILLSVVCERRREYLFAHPEKKLSLGEMRRFSQLVSRRAAGIPLAYLIHHKEFYKLDFYVDERCLIPRPDTELLVDLAIERTKSISKPLIFDVGTGSGALAVALAKNISGSRIIASDISEEALAVARKNVKKYRLENRITLLQSNLFENLHQWKPHAIIANLPYGDDRLRFFEKEVREHEPMIALKGGGDGLDLYRKLFQEIVVLFNNKGNPAERGSLIGEFGFSQLEGIKKIYRHVIKKHFSSSKMEFHDDLAGIPRAFVITFN